MTTILGSPCFGDEALVARRLILAKAIASQLLDAGLFPYAGPHYPGFYDAVLDAPAVFVDAHSVGQRISFLRRPVMPSVIIETHHGLDQKEVEQWAQPETRDSFARASAAGLSDAIRLWQAESSSSEGAAPPTDVRLRSMPSRSLEPRAMPRKR